MPRLAEFLQDNALSKSEFARRINRDRSTVHRIVTGEVRPDWSTMDAIFEATGYQVSPNDFLSPALILKAAAHG